MPFTFGTNDLFFYKLVAALEAEMGEAYPELGQRRESVERVIKQEEERFAETLHQGMKILEQAIDGLSGSEIPRMIHSLPRSSRFA